MDKVTIPVLNSDEGIGNLRAGHVNSDRSHYRFNFWNHFADPYNNVPTQKIYEPAETNLSSAKHYTVTIKLIISSPKYFFCSRETLAIPILNLNLLN